MKDQHVVAVPLVVVEVDEAAGIDDAGHIVRAMSDFAAQHEVC